MNSKKPITPRILPRYISLICLIILTTFSFAQQQKIELIASGKFSSIEARNVSVAAVSDDAYVVTYSSSQHNHASMVVLGIRNGSDIEFYGEKALFEGQHISSLQTISLNKSQVVAIGQFASGGRQYPVVALIEVDIKNKKINVPYDKGLQNSTKGFDKFAAAYIKDYTIGLVYYVNETRELFATAIDVSPVGSEYYFSDGKHVLIQKGIIDQLDVCGFKTGMYYYDPRGMVISYSDDSKNDEGFVQSMKVDRYEIEKESITEPKKFTDFMGAFDITRVSDQDFVVAYEDIDGNVSLTNGSLAKGSVTINNKPNKSLNSTCSKVKAKGVGKNGTIITLLDESGNVLDNYFGITWSTEFIKAEPVQANKVNSVSVDYPKQFEINNFGFAYGGSDEGKLYIAKFPYKLQNFRFQDSGKEEEKYKGKYDPKYEKEVQDSKYKTKDPSYEKSK